MRESPKMDVWRIGWCVGGSIVSALRGTDTAGFGLAHQLMGVKPLKARFGSREVARCHPRPNEAFNRDGLKLAPHRPPHPDCYCGIHGCERLAYLAHLVAAMVGPQKLLTSASHIWGAPPPGMVIYRVLLEGAVESAHYKHWSAEYIASEGGKRFQADPPGTWRGAEAKVVGPIIVNREPAVGPLARSYDVPAVFLGEDMTTVHEALMDREPEPSAKPCKRCRYTVGHAADCWRFDAWWLSCSAT